MQGCFVGLDAQTERSCLARMGDRTLEDSCEAVYRPEGHGCLRGHLGSYKVRVTYNNTVKEVDCHLEKSGSELLVTL